MEVDPSILYLDQMGMGSETRPWAPMPYTKQVMQHVFHEMHSTGWQLPRKWLRQPHADENMRKTADKLLTRAILTERSFFFSIYGYERDVETSALPESQTTTASGWPICSIRESDLPAIAECLLNYIGWCPPEMSTIWVVRNVGHNALPSKTPLTSMTLAQGWDVAMIYRLGEVSRDWGHSTFRGRVNQRTLVF